MHGSKMQLVLVFIGSIYGTVYCQKIVNAPDNYTDWSLECSSTLCEQATINCPTNADCDISCPSNKACYKAKINWPTSNANYGSISCLGRESCSYVNHPIPNPNKNYTLQCRGNFQSCGPSSTIYCPTNANCDVQCVASSACLYAKINWPLNGNGSISCIGNQACRQVKFPMPLPNRDFHFECVNMACEEATILCPINADCHITCRGDWGCSDAHIHWSTNGNNTLTCIDPPTSPPTPCILNTAMMPSYSPIFCDEYPFLAACDGVNAPPTNEPSNAPTNFTAIPTLNPSMKPTMFPTNDPSFVPTFVPSFTPTNNPSFYPTKTPTFDPSFTPTFVPSFTPTKSPTFAPSFTPTNNPSFYPTKTPTTPNPTLVIAGSPSYTPTYLEENATERFSTESIRNIGKLNSDKKTNEILSTLVIVIGIVICIVCFIGLVIVVIKWKQKEGKSNKDVKQLKMTTIESNITSGYVAPTIESGSNTNGNDIDVVRDINKTTIGSQMKVDSVTHGAMSDSSSDDSESEHKPTKVIGETNY